MNLLLTVIRTTNGRGLRITHVFLVRNLEQLQRGLERIRRQRRMLCVIKDKDDGELVNEINVKDGRRKEAHTNTFC